MKKLLVFVTAATLFTASVPAFAATHGMGHDPADADCARDCELLLKNCSQDVDTIQQKIRKLEIAIRKEGANPEKVAEVRVLKQKLDDANETLRTIEKGGH